MSNILRISDAASIAIHTVYYLAVNNDNFYTTKEIATHLKVSENHLAKVMQRLAKADLVESVRGPKGGFKLGKACDSITLLDIYESIDGPLKPVNCLLGDSICDNNCILGGLLVNLNTQVYDYFKLKKLSDFISPKS